MTAATGQWSSLLLELNLMKQAWRSYGVDINMKAPGLKNVLIMEQRYMTIQKED